MTCKIVLFWLKIIISNNSPKSTKASGADLEQRQKTVKIKQIVKNIFAACKT